MRYLNKKFFLATTVAALVILLVAGCKGTEPTSEQPPEKVSVSSADYASCGDCHKKVSDEQDYSLATAMAKLEDHPEVSAENIVDCQSCHALGSDSSLVKILHRSHYSGDGNHFINHYDGSCVHCHKLAENGTVPVADLAAEGTTFITIEVISVDRSPNGCLDCHKSTDDADRSLTASLAKIENHPKKSIKTADDCVSCHEEGTSSALSGLMHQAHLQGENYQTYYGNSCLNCHDRNNKMKVKGL